MIRTDLKYWDFPNKISGMVFSTRFKGIFPLSSSKTTALETNLSTELDWRRQIAKP